VAFLGQYVHWTLNEVLNLDHAERRRWVGAVTEQLEAVALEEDGNQ
jgi:hypothetical protein